MCEPRKEMQTKIRRSSMPAASGWRRGFTLVETLVAVAVFVIAAMGLTATIAQGDSIGDGVRERQAAEDATDAVFARMHATPFHELATEFHARGFEVDGLRAREGDEDGWPGEVSLAYGTDRPENYYVATVRVRWTGRAGERLVESVRFFANVFGDIGVPVALESVTPGGEIDTGGDLGNGGEGETEGEAGP
jgi:prepilin-type N-terminal cleavage/methylation domain-containing protein